MKEDEYLIHYGVLGMKWGVRKVNKKVRKAAYNQRRSVYEETLSKAAKRIGDIKSAEKHKNRAVKYNDRSVSQLKNANEDAKKQNRKIKSEKNPKNKQKIKEYLSSEKHKSTMNKVKYDLDNAQNLDLAFKEASKRSDNKRIAISSAIGAGMAVVTTLATGGFFATPAVSVASTQAAKTGMQYFTHINGDTVLVNAAGEIIKRS